MADNFDLPKELRLIIFHYVFTASRGVIGFDHPSDGGPRKITVRRPDKVECISLSILRTCKRFYWDCKDLLWKLNMFDLETVLFRFQDSPNVDILDLNSTVWHNIRSVELEIGFTGSTSDIARASWLDSSLKGLGSWEKLASIIFIVRGDFSDCVKAMNGLQRLRRGFSPDIYGITMNKCLGILEGAGTEGGYLSHLKRKIVFNLDYEIPTDQDWTSPTPPLGMDTEPAPIADKIFMELATSFGGDIIVNGELCYSNRIQKKSLFYSRLDSEHNYTQLVSLKKDCVLRKLGFIYAKSTDWGKDSIRKHLLGKRVLWVSTEQMEAIRKDLEEWLERVPKQLARLTKEMIEKYPLEVVEAEEQYATLNMRDNDWDRCSRHSTFEG